MSPELFAMPLAAFRENAANFISTLTLVYFVLIIAHILFGLVRNSGARIPYNPVINSIEKFLHDAVEPYLSIFRRFIPPLGPLDLSPVVAIFVLNFVGRLVATLVQG